MPAQLGPRALEASTRVTSFLCLSDIHGDLASLSAMFALAERYGYAHLLVAGDHCFPGASPSGVLERLFQRRAVCAQGASDRALALLDASKVTARSDSERTRLARFSDVRAILGEGLLRKLAELPSLVRVPLPPVPHAEHRGELLLVHGSPADPLEPMTHDMTDAELASLLGGETPDIVVCGASHVPFHRVLRLGERVVHIVNAGSVGDSPTENGEPGGPRVATAMRVEVEAASPPAPASDDADEDDNARAGPYLVKVDALVARLEPL